MRPFFKAFMRNRIERTAGIVSLFASGTYALMTQFGGGGGGQQQQKKFTPSLSPLDRKKQEATRQLYKRENFQAGLVAVSRKKRLVGRIKNKRDGLSCCSRVWVRGKRVCT